MLRRFLLVGAVVGLLVPLVLLARWKLADQSFGLFELWLWPASILHMAISTWQDPWSWVLLAFTVLLNVLMYVFIAAIIYAAVYLVGRLLPASWAEP